MDYLEYKGYKGSVEYSKDDNCLFGKVQGLSKELITYEGQTLDELRKDLVLLCQVLRLLIKKRIASFNGEISFLIIHRICEASTSK